MQLSTDFIKWSVHDGSHGQLYFCYGQFEEGDFGWNAKDLELFTKLFASFYPLDIGDKLPLTLWLALIARAIQPSTKDESHETEKAPKAQASNSQASKEVGESHVP